MNKLIPALIFVAFMPFQSNFAQSDNFKNLDEVAEKVRGNDWIKIKTGNDVDPGSFMEKYKSSFGLDENHSFKLVKKETDKYGFTHYRYQQYYKGIPIEGGEYLVHAKNGKVQTANGKIVSGIKSTSNPSLTASSALQSALDHKGAEKYAWEDKGAEKALQKIKNNPQATLYPQPELVYIDPSFSKNGEKFKLAYKMDLYALEPLSREYIYIDAQSGEAIHAIERIHTGDANGTAETKYSGTQSIVTDSVSANQFRLREAGRGGGIETFNMLEGTTHSNAVDFTDSDNYWNNVNAKQDEAATDAHWAAEMTYDYFMLKHSRNSYDNAGSKLISYVHYDKNYSNAFWNGSWMTYGDGDGSTYTALTSLDVGGHEIAHGVTEYSANLVYQDEPGAINESFSDIFGAAVEFYADSANADWYIGEDFDQGGNGFRNMENPNAAGDPDTYGGINWYTGTQDNGGVHTNSGVQNFWFHLLVEGGSGTNDHGNAYNISGLGLDTAAAIAYRNLSVYLTQSSEYMDAREGAIQSAEDLYGACSNAAVQTANAWFAVGVGNPVVDNDIWMLDLESPQTACGLTNAETVTVQMRYNGCNLDLVAGDSLPVAYRVDGGSIVNDTAVLSSTVKGGDTISFSFSTPADLSAQGMHEIDAWVSFSADSLNFNDSLIGYKVENKLQQNIDVGLVEITSPSTSCNLTASENIGVQLSFYGCDSLAAGDSIALGYRINGGTAINDTLVLSSSFYPEDTIAFNFSSTADFSSPGTYTIESWTAFDVDTMNNNDMVSGYEVKNPEKLMDQDVVVFEDNTGVLDSMIITSGSEADAYVSSQAKYHGDYGLQMTGGDPFNYDGDIVIPDGNNNWLVNEDFGAMTCFCVDATTWSSAELRFDLKQTFSSLYNLQFGQDVPEASSLRVVANGNQIGGTYMPTTYDSDPFVRHHVNLDAFAGGMMEVCFETRMGINPSSDFLGDGDNAYLDNIFVSEVSTIGIEEEDNSNSSAVVYPNPNDGNFTIAYHSVQAKSVELIMSNMLGEIVVHRDWDIQKGRNTLMLSSGEIESGVYFVKMQDAQGSLVKKVIVN